MLFKYCLFVDGRRWERYRDLRNARRARENLRKNELFRKRSIIIIGPNGGHY